MFDIHTIRQPKDDSTVKMYKRQANLIRQKKDKLQTKLDSYKEDYSKLMEQKNKLENDLKQYEGLKIPSEAEFEEYKQELLKKATKCKHMKTELADIEAEIQVLQDTQNVIMTKQHSNLLSDINSTKRCI
jgi:chromosome segregation ATPase